MAAPFGADRAQQLVGAAFADPGRGGDLAGGQPGAGGALVATLRATETAVAQATRVPAYHGSLQASPRR
jgi:hypothetical protein